MLTTEQINRITIELLTGADQAEPDSDEAAQFREKLKKQLEDVKEGDIVQLPNE